MYAARTPPAETPRLGDIALVQPGINLIRGGFIADGSDLRQVDGKKGSDRPSRPILVHMTALVRNEPRRPMPSSDENGMPKGQPNHMRPKQSSLGRRKSQGGIGWKG